MHQLAPKPQPAFAQLSFLCRGHRINRQRSPGLPRLTSDSAAGGRTGGTLGSSFATRAASRRTRISLTRALLRLSGLDAAGLFRPAAGDHERLPLSRARRIHHRAGHRIGENAGQCELREYGSTIMTTVSAPQRKGKPGQMDTTGGTRRAHPGPAADQFHLTMSNSAAFQSAISMRHSSCKYDGLSAPAYPRPKPVANSLLTGKITGNCNCSSASRPEKCLKFISLAP